MNHEAFDRIGEFKLYRGVRDCYTQAENPEMVFEPGRHAVVQVGDLFLTLRMNVIYPFHIGPHDVCLIRADQECGNGTNWRQATSTHLLENQVLVECADQDYHDTIVYKTAKLQLLRTLKAKELEHSELESVIAYQRGLLQRFL